MPKLDSQNVLSRLMDMDHDARNNVLMNSTVKDAAEKILNSVEDQDVKLKVNKVWVDNKLDNKNVSQQKEYRMKNKIWGNDLKADVELLDKKTGKIIDRVSSIKVANIPKITDRGTYIIKGNEYQFTKQSRLKPGVYTKRQSNGEISSFFNVDKTIDFDRGFNNNFKINFNPEKKIFTMGYGSKNIPLYNALKAVGVSSEEMKKAWGNDVFEENRKAYEKHEVRDQNKLYEAIFGRVPEKDMTLEKVKDDIKERLFKTKLDESTTKITLGKSYDSVDKGPLIDASKKIINIHKGDEEGDDRESLIFKSFYDVEDHVREKMVKNATKIVSNLKHKLKKNKSINQAMSSQTFDPFVIGTMTNSQLSNPPNQTNPMSILGESNKITVMGEGGIGTSNAITNETRQISNSEAGFLDPLHTPEGSSIGVAVHSSLGAVKIGNDIYSKFLDKNGDKQILRPVDVYDKNISFPDQFDIIDGKPKPVSKKVKVISKGKLKEIDAKDVDAIIASPMTMFDVSANSIPFLDSIQGNRGLTASKMQEQALSLTNRDKPLFKIIDDKGNSFAETVASSMATPKSPAAGVVERITDSEIIIKDKDGKKHNIELYTDFSLNSESFIHNEPVVKEGDSVKKGQLLADNNFTKDGQMALGANLNVAYMPYKGYNFEDSAIMSESAAKKLTSQHMYDLKTKRSSKGIFSKNKFKAYYPEELNSKNYSKLDSSGVVRVGQKLERGDIAIAHLERSSPTADDIAVGRLDKQLKRDMADNAIRWENDNLGIVTGVEKHGNSVVVNVKTNEQLKVADKISGLHGNKHIISKIVPDDQMPFNPKTGERVELTMSPIGVSNRINPSQILESAAGKIAKKTGKQYEIKNFNKGDNARKVMEDLKANGLSDKDYLVDPETGVTYVNPVATGISHILKLEHKVDHKYSARYKEGYDSNEQPMSGGETGGKNVGRMEMAALLARGATENLKEMFQIKGQRNDEYWRAMETGQSLPPSKKAFVWDKMMAMMSGAGINVEQKGKTYSLKPMTDEEILSRSRGELKRPFDTYRKKDLAPMKEGLFDPVKAGGIQGEHFTHFSLPEKILNPINASATATLLDIPNTKLDDIINGKQFVDKTTGKLVKPGSPNSISGGPAVEMLLERLDVDENLKYAKEIVESSTNSTELNKMNRKIRYLKALKENKMKPTDYMISNVLVTPSKYRPMFSMGTDGTVIMSDINDLYQQTAYSANALKDLKDDLKTAVDNEDIQNLQLAESRGQLYQDVKAISGLREPTSYLHRVKDKKGYISQIDGGKKKQTKEGFFQDKVLERRQDLVGRSTIILNPDIGGDEIGIPKEMATKIFQPFIMKKLVSWGYSPLEAQKMIKDKDKVFERARQVVSDERLVIANRAPTLHRWNMTSFKPKLTDGKSIEVPGIVVSKNFGGDFDGDCQNGNVIISIKSTTYKESIKKDNLIKKKNIDSDLDVTYNYSDDMWLNYRRINIPSISKLPIDSGEDFFHINLSDFPRLESTKKIEENGNITYKVPDGISVVTCDNVTHKVIKTPVTEFSIHYNLSNSIIKLSDRNELLTSADESLIAINTDSWELERVTPKNIIGKAIPKIKNIEINESIDKIPLKDYRTKKNNKTPIVVDEVYLDREFGHFLGIMVGDGWISRIGSGGNPDQICLSGVDKNVSDFFSRSIDKLLSQEIKMTSIKSPHDFDGHKSFSIKHTKCSISLAQNIKNLIGSGAHHKHLPPFYMSSPKEFRYGLLSGLIDTDGSISWTNGGDRKQPQLSVNYTTVSQDLAMQIISLCRSLGIVASITESEKYGKPVYTVVLSTTTIHNKPIKPLVDYKLKNLSDFQNIPLKKSSVSARLDLVPISEDIFNIAKKIVKSNKHRDEYGAMKTGIAKGAMSRETAKKIIDLIPEGVLPQRWVDIVNNLSITWIYAKEVINNKNKITMYDITAPGPYTFMLDNGIIVQDTFQIHTPISAKALKEAEGMLPSASMLKTGFDSVLNKPEMDMIVGSWLVSKGRGGKNTDLKFKSIEDAREAFKNNKFSYADRIEIDGKKAPFGMHEINSAAPDDSKVWDKPLDSKNVEDWIRDVTKKHNGKVAIGLADRIKDVGNNYSTNFGFTLGVSDILSMPSIREKYIQEAESKINKKSSDTDVIRAYADAKNKAEKELEKIHSDKSMLGIGISSGGSKGIGNTTAISMMPGIVTDADDRPIAMPITKSYSEGLDTFGYWTAAHGARGGNIKKSVSSFKPGWLTKDLINSIYDTKIYSDSPVDKQGLEYNINDKKGVINRYLAQDAKSDDGKVIARRNEVVNSDTFNKLVKNKIKSVFVQSPITDPSPGDGFSSYSYGSDYNGKRHNIGDNIGVISAHTITEPSLNMAMKAFHTGGALEGVGKKSNVGTLFDRLDRTLRFTTNIPDKATLSSMDAKVKSVNKSSIGGYDVVLDDGEKEEVRYVIPGNDVLVKPGQKVRKGDKISTGTTSAHDVLKYKGMRDTQKFLVDEIDKINDGKLDKRDIETIVRGITNTTRIMDSGDHPNYVTGDVAQLTAIESQNEIIKKKGGRPVKHEPFLTPTGIQAKAKSSEDWIARLAHNRIRKVLEDGTTMGWKSTIDPIKGHPLPQYVTGDYTW